MGLRPEQSIRYDRYIIPDQVSKAGQENKTTIICSQAGVPGAIGLLLYGEGPTITNL